MNTKILFVDDELNVLDAIKRSLRKDFDIGVAQSGIQALSLIECEGPFAVIVSDMRMPTMDGVQLLRRVKEIAPETVRIMLTGNADQQTATNAVNEGSIFRFLTKPCPPDEIVSTFNAALEQHRLVTAEKHLLEQTLNQSLQVLLDILSIVNPTAFSRSSRVKKIARDIADSRNLEKAWEVEFAAMLSQIGCFTVPEEILQKLASGSPLSNRETGLYNQHPQIGHDLIIRIPRLEIVAEIVAGQNRRLVDETSRSATSKDAAILGARILKVALDFDKQISNGLSAINAMRELSDRTGWYDLDILSTLKEIVEISSTDYESIEVGISDLKPGMFLDKPLTSVRGSTLLPSGQEITMSLILRLANLVEAGIVADKIMVNAPAGHFSRTATLQAG